MFRENTFCTSTDTAHGTHSRNGQSQILAGVKLNEEPRVFYIMRLE